MAAVPTRTTLGWYLDQIKSTPLLTREQECQLARRIREHSDPIAREQMIAANLRLVVKIAKDYSNPGMTLGDLVAEGNLGLLRAVEEFDPDAGVRFSTYAAWWIKQSVKRAMINAGQPIHIPAYLAKLLTKWRHAQRDLEAKLGRPVTTEEMAAAMHISKKKAEIIAQGLVATGAPSQMGGEDAQTMSEVVADDSLTAPDTAMMAQCDGPVVQGLLEHLDQRLRRIVELRFGLDGYEGPPRTYKQIGQVIGLTRERVRQLEKIALTKLREQMDAA